MIACILYYIPFLLIFSYLLFASLCTRVFLSSLSFSLIRSLVSAISQSSLVTSIFNDQTTGTDSPVCSLGITTISPGVNALRLHGWHHPILSYLFLVLFFHSAYQPFSWCWCGPDSDRAVFWQYFMGSVTCVATQNLRFQWGWACQGSQWRK